MNNYKGPALRRCIEEAHLRRHLWGGTFESNPRMFESHFNPKKWETGTYIWFAKKARMLPVKCASSDSFVPNNLSLIIHSEPQEKSGWRNCLARTPESMKKKSWSDNPTWCPVHGNEPWLTWLGRHVPHPSVAVDDNPTQNLQNHISGHRCVVLTILLPVKIMCPFPRSSQVMEY